MAKPTQTLPLEPNFQNIPADLIALDRWVVWAYESRKGGKPQKVPKCAAVLNSNASVIDPDTWTSFEQTQTAYEEGGFSGVGIVLDGDGLVGIDLDNCVIDGVPSQHAANEGVTGNELLLLFRGFEDARAVGRDFQIDPYKEPEFP